MVELFNYLTRSWGVIVVLLLLSIYAFGWFAEFFDYTIFSMKVKIMIGILGVGCAILVKRSMVL